MDIDVYAKETLNTAVYPGAGRGTKMAVTYTVLGLGAEVGELQNTWKKVLRGDDIDPVELRKNSMDELGDIAWYFCRVCEELNVRPSDVLELNRKKLTERMKSQTIHGHHREHQE